MALMTTVIWSQDIMQIDVIRWELTKHFISIPTNHILNSLADIAYIHLSLPLYHGLKSCANVTASDGETLLIPEMEMRLRHYQLASIFQCSTQKPPRDK